MGTGFGPVISPLDLGPARAFLQQRQAIWGRLAGKQPSQVTLRMALEAATLRESSARRDGTYVLEGAFRFDAATEDRRWALTRAIIERVNPGPFEDPRYLEMVARQTASVEMGLQPPDRHTKFPPEVLSRIIVGTTGEARSDAYSAKVRGAVVIAMSAGMMDFMYQASKALVLAWMLRDGPTSGSYSYSARAEDTEAQLHADPFPIRLFRDVIFGWLYEGYPRPASSRAPQPERAAPLGLLINHAERFVIGHEYGHALLHHLKVVPDDIPMPPGVSPSWHREFVADAFGVLLIIDSCAWLDRLPANIALQGAMVAMKAHELFEHALVVARTGRGGAPQVSTSHPPFAERIALLEHLYLRNHPDPDAGRKDIEGMLAPSRTLDQLWDRVVPELEEQFTAGTALHPLWSEGDGAGSIAHDQRSDSSDK